MKRTKYILAACSLVIGALVLAADPPKKPDPVCAEVLRRGDGIPSPGTSALRAHKKCAPLPPQKAKPAKKK